MNTNSGPSNSKISTQTPCRYRTEIQVTFSLTDAAGILFFANFFRLAQDCQERWSKTRPGGWEVWYGDRKLGYPIRHVEADFRTPCFFGDLVQIEVHLESITESTFVLHTRFLKQGQLCAVVETVHTAVDFESFTKASIAPALRAFFADQTAS